MQRAPFATGPVHGYRAIGLLVCDLQLTTKEVSGCLASGTAGDDFFLISVRIGLQQQGTVEMCSNPLVLGWAEGYGDLQVEVSRDLKNTMLLQKSTPASS